MLSPSSIIFFPKASWLFKKPKENLNTTAYITTFDNPIFEMSLYSEPNINSKVKYKCPKDSKVKVIDNSGKIFFKVIVNGYSGYVSKHYLKERSNNFNNLSTKFTTTFDNPIFEIILNY